MTKLRTGNPSVADLQHFSEARWNVEVTIPLGEPKEGAASLPDEKPGVAPRSSDSFALWLNI